MQSEPSCDAGGLRTVHADAVRFAVLVGMYSRGSFEPHRRGTREETPMSHDRAEDEIAINAMLGEMYQAFTRNLA